MGLKPKSHAQFNKSTGIIFTHFDVWWHALVKSSNIISHQKSMI